MPRPSPHLCRSEQMNVELELPLFMTRFTVVILLLFELLLLMTRFTVIILLLLELPLFTTRFTVIILLGAWCDIVLGVTCSAIRVGGVIPLSSRTTVRMMRIDIITMLIRSKACVLLRFLGDFVLLMVKTARWTLDGASM